MTIYTKVCSKCKITKTLSEFSKDKSRKDGYDLRCKSCRKEQHQNNKEANNVRSQQYYQDNLDKVKETRKKYRENNPEKIKEWRENNPEKIKEWREDNPDYQREYLSNRRKTDPLFKLSCNIRSLIYISIKNGGFAKRSKTHKILGCSFDEFKIHIESQFTEGMSWDNHGEWHFDHKTPVSWAETEEEIVALNNYINFQPLWAEDNIRKGNRFNGHLLS